MATENALMAAVLAPGRDGRSATPPASRTSRTSAASSSRWAREIDGIGSNVLRIQRRRRGSAAARAAIGPDHIEVGSFIGARRRDRRRAHDRGRRARRPASRSCPRSRKLGIELEVDGDDAARAAGPEARRRRRPRRPDPEDRGRPLARVPGRPHVDRRRRRDAGAGHGARSSRRCSRAACSSSTSWSSMGARIMLCDPHRAVVSGPGRLAASGSRAPTSAPAWRC